VDGGTVDLPDSPDGGVATGEGDGGVATGEGDGDPGAHDPLRFNQWMKRSATGAVLSGIALGLQQALEPKRELPAFVMEAPGEPEDPDAPITLHFDPDDPTRTVAVIRAPAPAHDESPGPGTPEPPAAGRGAASDR
jgi:hypothetical protein